MPLTSDETIDLAEVDLSDPDLFADGPPHTLFERMRREAPVRWNPMPDGPGFWAVVRHADIAAVSKDTETFSSWLGGTMIREETVPLPVARQMMINMDPPQHTAYRELVSTAFKASRVANLEAHVREIARNLIDGALEKGEFDLVEDIAVPLPLQVIGELLGVPPEHHPKLAEWAGASAGSTTPGCGRRASTHGRTLPSGLPSSMSSRAAAAGATRRPDQCADSSRAGWPSAHRGRVGLVPRADPRCRDRHDP